jgi:hypothetical protein
MRPKYNCDRRLWSGRDGAGHLQFAAVYNRQGAATRGHLTQDGNEYGLVQIMKIEIKCN